MAGLPPDRVLYGVLAADPPLTLHMVSVGTGAALFKADLISE